MVAQISKGFFTLFSKKTKIEGGCNCFFFWSLSDYCYVVAVEESVKIVSKAKKPVILLGSQATLPPVATEKLKASLEVSFCIKLICTCHCSQLCKLLWVSFRCQKFLVILLIFWIPILILIIIIINNLIIVIVIYMSPSKATQASLINRGHCLQHRH